MFLFVTLTPSPHIAILPTLNPQPLGDCIGSNYYFQISDRKRYLRTWCKPSISTWHCRLLNIYSLGVSTCRRAPPPLRTRPARTVRHSHSGATTSSRLYILSSEGQRRSREDPQKSRSACRDCREQHTLRTRSHPQARRHRTADRQHRSRTLPQLRTPPCTRCVSANLKPTHLRGRSSYSIYCYQPFKAIPASAAATCASCLLVPTPLAIFSFPKKTPTSKSFA